MNRPRPGWLRPRSAALAALALLALAACKGGGPTGGGGDDRPPAPPNLAVITISAPVNGLSFVVGATGAVEARATVQVTNLTASQRTGTTVRASSQAGTTGSFQVAIQAQLGDALELVAIDASGNQSSTVAATAGPPISSIQLRVTFGDQQTGVQGRALTDSFRVNATVAQTSSGVPGLAVIFESETPGGTFSQTRVITDNNGSAASVYTLSGTLGPHSMRARLELAETTVVRGSALAVPPPQVTGMTPAAASPGDTVTVTGANFSTIPHHNVVRFGTERASVLSATSTVLRVVVPVFATGGPLSVELTGVSSNLIQVTVNPAVVVGRALGEVATPVSFSTAGTGQVVLPFENAAQEFTLVIQSLAASSASSGLTVRGAGATLRQVGGLAPAAAEPSPISGESYIRSMERRLSEGLTRTRTTAPRGLAPAQDLGSTRQFFVVNKPTAISRTNPADFDRITATLRYKGDNTLVYVDNRSSPGLTDAELNQIGDRFDDLSYPVEVDAFGPPSDLDGNGKVIILLSPTVNALTTPEIMAQNARIVGFFFSLDLQINPTQNPHANNGEVFYGVVPNENNEFTGARVTRAEFVGLTGSVSAHEFQHMISYNQHVIVRGGSPESLWLDEGLSHMAETLTGFDIQNQLRAALFLDSPQDVTLTAGGDGLDERGAAWLFVQYLSDRFGRAILRRLVQTNQTTIVNVETAAGRPFAALFSDWSTMLLVDGPAVEGNDAIFELPSFDVRRLFEDSRPILGTRLGPTYLDLRALSVPGGALAFNLRGTSPLYVAVTSRGRANVPVTIEGQPLASLQVTVIRTK